MVAQPRRRRVRVRVCACMIDFGGAASAIHFQTVYMVWFVLWKQNVETKMNLARARRASMQ